MSSHREAPGIAKDPVADNTDTYAWVTPNNTVTIITNYVPVEAPAGGPNFYEFGDDCLYEINIDNDGDGRANVTYQFRFESRNTNPNTFLYNTGPITALDSARNEIAHFYPSFLPDQRHFLYVARSLTRGGPTTSAVFVGSLDCLAPLGMYVNFGNASGPVPQFDPLLLSQKGSLFMTRPTLVHYTAKREDLLAAATDLFEVVKSGNVKIEIAQRYPLKDAAQAHRDLESRKTTGSAVLLP